jgi:Reverse transcriptase (RNA-dependent DNA polymerase)
LIQRTSSRIAQYRTLSVISKLLERLVCKQLLIYLKESNLLPTLQSAYSQYYSTETAVLKVVSDILSALDYGNLSVLALLDLSAAFYRIDHSTLLQRFRVSYGISGTVLNWITSYLSDRFQHVRLGETRSPPSSVGPIQLPQGSVLGPVFFIMYADPLQRLIESHQLTSHGYADDTQIYGSCRPTDVGRLAQKMSICIDEVSLWMKANRLQLNQSKTEVVWFASSRSQHQIPSYPVRVGTEALTYFQP